MNNIFSIPDFQFPEGFLWGSSTAGHQIEGDNIHSNWWHIEQVQVLEKKNPDWELSGKACNSYELYEEDSKILQQLHHGVYRMSIEWARIEPAEGEFRIEEIDHYIKVFESLKSRGIQVSLTMVHFAVPQWFNAKGGFNAMENLPYFERYLEYTVPKIAQYVDFWCVMNEFNMGFADPKAFDFKFNSVRYHARGYHIIKQYSSKPVSTAHAFIQYFGRRQGDEFDLAMQKYCDLACNEFWFNAVRTGELVLPFHDGIYDKEIKDSCDYWAINTYLRRMIDSRKANFASPRYTHRNVKLLTDSTFYINEFDPECLVHNLTRLKDKPVYITENGLCCEDDAHRIVWLVEYLSAMKDCIDMGVDVKGYMYWSLLDNYEWGSFKPTFGLVGVDREHDFKRTIKPSGYFFKEIIDNNGFSQEILRKYLQTYPTSSCK